MREVFQIIPENTVELLRVKSGDFFRWQVELD